MSHDYSLSCHVPIAETCISHFTKIKHLVGYLIAVACFLISMLCMRVCSYNMCVCILSGIIHSLICFSERMTVEACNVQLFLLIDNHSFRSMDEHINIYTLTVSGFYHLCRVNIM